MKTKTIAIFGMLALLTFAGLCNAADSGPALADAFKNPPPETRPWCYWYWISNNISKEGVTRDLEAMARVGIGEAFIGHVVNPGTPLGDVPLFSDEWWEILEHAVREGDRVGVRISLFNSPGWSQSGGPWNKPEQAMRYVVSSETRVTGPKEFVGKLPVPKEPFQDIAVVAVPVPKADGDKIAIHKPTIVCSPAVKGVEKLVDGDRETGVAIPAKTAKKGATWTIDLETADPFTARSIAVHPTSGNFAVQCRLEAADSHGNFRKIREFSLDRKGPRAEYKVNVGPMIKGPAVVSFDPVTSRKFRLVVCGLQGQGGLTEIDLSGATRLDHYVDKQLGKMHPTPLPSWNSYIWPPAQEPDASEPTIAADTTRNISDKMSPDGTLRWDVPKGEWIIQRFGMTPTGAKNHPTTVEGQGLEVDKMSRPAVESHFNAMVGKLVERMPEADRKALHHVVIDSYEVGSENWTDGFDQDFRQTFGYDPKPWLPVLTGRIVGSADQSDRFLWDLRRLVADRIARDYVGGLRDVCHQHGLKLWLENYGHWGFPAEFLQYGGQSDDLGGEFWFGITRGGVELRAASSAAHLYGKRVVSAEAFTSARSFQDYPAALKARGDWAYCHGINHFVLHVYIHQPWEDRRPGVNAWFGTEFNRHNTWFEQSKSWIDYLRRCHLLLQQGRSTADVAYFIGEDAPKMTGPLEPALPEGYDYDFINAEVLLSRAHVENGCLTIPGGPSYRILVLPPQETMRPELLRKLRDFVADGMAVLGPAPRRSPSLQNYPACDDEVRRLAGEIWGEGDGRQSTERVLGRGRVFCGIDLVEALKRLDIAPDIVVPEGILWVHRQTDDGDIYFISNQQPKARLAEVSFRVGGRVPEIWNAKSGTVEETGWFTSEGDRTRVPLSLDPDGSAFVVFRKPVDGVSIARVEKDGQPLAADKPCPIKIARAKDGQLMVTVDQPGVYTLRQADGKELFTAEIPSLSFSLAIEGPWQLKFPAGSGAPESLDVAELKSWPKFEEESIRHFAGTATYKTTFDVPSDLISNGRRLMLDLGRVETIAEVRLNGQDLGRLWKKPYALDVTDAVKPGKNTLEVEVTNNWWNRLVGNEKLPAEKRSTFTTAKLRGASRKLLPSGLIGPVRIVPSSRFSIKP